MFVATKSADQRQNMRPLAAIRLVEVKTTQQAALTMSALGSSQSGGATVADTASDSHNSR
jgi:hypothetical protein